MKLSKSFSDCEKLFLEVAYDPSLLEEALNLSAKLFNGHAAQIFTFDNYGELLSSRHVGFDASSAHKEIDYLDINPRLKAAAKSKQGQILYDYINLTDDEIKTDITYQELLKPANLDWYAGTKLFQDSNRTVLFGVFRDEQSGHFNQEEISQFKWLADRVSASTATALRIDEIKWKSKLSALEASKGAIAAISVTGSIIEMSPEFRPLLNKYNIGALSSRGTLKVKDPVIETFLKVTLPAFHRNMTSINTAALQNTGRMVRSKSGDWVELQLYPVSMVSRWAHSGAVALISLKELKDINPKPKELYDLFSLSPAEGETAVLLANGKTLKEASSIRKVSYETVRSQVKSILQKTECRNQRELAILMNRLLS